MGWPIVLFMVFAILGGLWRIGGLDRPSLQFVGAALLLGMAGYAWQGRPILAGKPTPPVVEREVPDSEFAKMRAGLLGRFDNAAHWLTISEVFQRRGDSESAAKVIQAGLREHPRDPDLWVGLGNALVIHGGGLMNPAAELAFQRAARLAPDHPGPKFFYGLALAQAGRFDEAERIWRAMLAAGAPGAEWRPMVEERVRAIERARAAGQIR
ncbi:tetratricopeptide repeat protein [Sphingosinicella rhizophila]|uniref:Tetratricopeptide repeat protein n=1 Tax=Sphingosinicella rhizophila TaxID=3050082 RepID=A0ABU3Q391_9SPHN|nr:tetratricopeptide repeat protein [Sphingosinicella sp. GR2756]MDT9597777.1 tetratricopeptide repeat protein [Sphingosinicella sp. GR2756]